MKLRVFKFCITLVILGLLTARAHAASIWLQPTSSTTININDIVTFDLYVDASDVGGILAGGLDIFYDIGVLSYNGDFTFDSGFPFDPFFSMTGEDCLTTTALGCTETGEINSIAFGEFNGLAAAGPALVGSLSFTGVGTGGSSLDMFDNDLISGQWFDISSNVINMNYTGSTITVVSIPAAVWLFVSGVLGLFTSIKE